MDKPKFAAKAWWISAARTFSRYLTRKQLRGEYRFRKIFLTILNTSYIRISYLGKGVIWVNPNEQIGSKVFWDDSYDLQTIRVIQEFMGNGYCYIDIGANIGVHLLGAAFFRRNADQTIIAFEPEPHNYTVLLKNIQENDLTAVTCYPIAVGQRNGTARLYLSDRKNRGKHSMTEVDGDQSSIDCQITTLDSHFLIRNQTTDTPTLIKIDVEGFESDVVAGGTMFLASLIEGAIIYEIVSEFLVKRNLSPDCIISSLEKTGFTNHYLINWSSGKVEPISGEELRSAEGLRRFGEDALNFISAKGSQTKFYLDKLL